MQQLNGATSPASGFQILVLGAFVLGVGLVCWIILGPFLSPIAWAAILAYTTWPLYLRLRRPFGRFQSAAAALMTLLVTCAVVLPILWIGILAGHEVIDAYRAFGNFFAGANNGLPAGVRDIPWLGEQLQRQLDRIAVEPASLAVDLRSWMQAWAHEFAALLGGIGRNVGKLVLTLVTVFVFYRDGESILRQGRAVATRFFGARLQQYLDTIGTMTRAVVYGLLVTAFAQGLIAGIGYWVLGIDAAALLGALTGALSVLPVLGTAIVWGSIAAYLIAKGHLWKGVILLIWGTAVVHPTDNILRPLLISNVTNVPFLLVIFGVLGGVAALGLVGVFLGPIFLAVGLALWREWAAEESP